MKKKNVKVTEKNGVKTAVSPHIRVFKFNAYGSAQTETETHISFEWTQCDDDDIGSIPLCSLIIKENGKRKSEYILAELDFKKLIKLSKLCPFSRAK